MAIFPPVWGGLAGAKLPAVDEAAKRKEMHRIMQDASSGIIQSGIYMGSDLVGVSANHTNPGNIRTDPQRMAHLEMRLRMTSTELRAKLPGLGTTYEEGMIYVHFVRAGQLQIFTDEPAMFPSDALVNNLRLCL